jgi:hypothetical protein
VAAITTHRNNHNNQPTPLMTIGFDPSLSDHPLEEQDDDDDLWDDNDADELL